ncbi:MAG: hypothetical protein KIS82_07830 [Ferruginibacter sp.]|nr:hypothetical protein [Ferruginibacter sp.]
MRTKLPLSWLVVLCICTASIQATAQQFRVKNSFSASEARAFAMKALPSVLQWIEPEDLELYGFAPMDDFSKIKVGRPFLLSSVSDVVQNNPVKQESGIEVSTLMVPLILGGQARCFLYVSNQEGGWKAVGIGGNGYIKGNESLFNQPDEKFGIIVAAHNLNEEFVVENTAVGIMYKPLFHVNREVVKNQYSFSEVSQMEMAAPQQIEP